MLSEHQRELLTAAVDGELGPWQRHTVRRLLNRSPDARRFYRQLQTDSRKLRALPRRAVPADLTNRILHAVGECGRVPVKRRSVSPWLRASVLANAAAAAAVLLAVALTSYLSLLGNRRPVSPPAVAEQTNPGKSTPEGILPLPTPVPAPEVLPGPRPLPDGPTAVVQGDPPKKPGPTPDRPPEIITAPPQESPNGPSFDVAPSDVAVILEAKDLSQAGPRKQTLDHLRKDKAARFDLLCRDPHKAFDRLQAALKARKHRIYVEPLAHDRHKKHLPTQFAFYAEGLSREEIVALVQRLAGEGAFDKFYLTPITADDRKDMTAVFGTDPTAPRPAKPKAPLGVDIRKPISENTVAQVTQALAGQGGATRPTGTGPVPPPKLPERTALALTFGPVRANPHASKEIKQYLDGRAERRPEALPVMFVLRAVKR